jgi:hypothetical protein
LFYHIVLSSLVAKAMEQVRDTRIISGIVLYAHAQTQVMQELAVNATVPAMQNHASNTIVHAMPTSPRTPSCTQ